MKVFAAIISFVLLLQYSTCFGAVASNFKDLVEASDHGHETGLANKEKRCHDLSFFRPLRLPLYDHFLGNPHLLPSVLKRRSPARNDGPMVQLASRFAESETGLSETQERYYTVGSFGAGPKQQILAKLLNIQQDVPLERLVVLAKNKSKAKASPVPHPVVIDTAHVFTRNDGKPAELNLELHSVKGDESEDINNLTSQLNKELDAAIDTKKTMLGDSHLTPQEIDKIIEHVVDQMKKKAPNDLKHDKELVGSTMDLTHPLESEMNDDLDGFKKKKKKGSKKHGFIDEEDDVVGAEEAVNFKDDVAEIPHKDDDQTLSEDDTVLGTKKGKGYGHGYGSSKGHSKGKGYGKGKGSHYRENEDVDKDEDANIKDENPLHADMTEFTGLETPMEHEQHQAIEDLLEKDKSTESDLVGLKKLKGYGKGHGYGKGKGKGHYRENEDTEDLEEDTVAQEAPTDETIQDHTDPTLGLLSKFKSKGGYGKGYGGYDKGGYGKGLGGFGKLNGLKLKGKGKGYYRESEDDDKLEEPQLGASQQYQNQPNQFQDYQGGYQAGNQQINEYAPAGNQQQYAAGQPAYQETYEQYPQNAPAYQEPVESDVYHGTGPVYHAPQSDSHYQENYQAPAQQVQPQAAYQQPAYQSQPQAAYQQPTYQEQSYQQPAYQAPAQAAYQEPSYQAEPQAAYQAPASSQSTYQEPAYQAPAQAAYQEPSYQVEPQAAYQAPTSSQSTYQESAPVYEEPAYQQQAYKQQYGPTPVQSQPTYQAPAQPQAAYSSSKNYKSVESPDEIEDIVNSEKPSTSVDDILGTSHDIPQDPTLKATFLENEVKRLRQWIADNGPSHNEKPSSPSHRQRQESDEKEELVDKFTKVIEKDLTDGKKLTPVEKKNLDKKIAKLVRDNLNDHDTHDAESKSRKKLDKLEELVEEEADENEESSADQKLGSNLDDFKSRFSPKINDNDVKDDAEVAPKKKLAFGDLLKSSLDNLKKDMTTKKPVIDLKHIVEDLKAMPNKLVDMIKPTASPKLGLRSGLGDKEEKNTEAIVGQYGKDDETVGCLEDLLDKKDDYGPEWHMDPDYHHDDYHHGHDDYHHDDYHDGYRASEKKNDVLRISLTEGTERSGEEDEPKTLPEIIKQIEENIEENLHLPPLPTLPAMRQSHNKHHANIHHTPENQNPSRTSTIPKIQVNGEHFNPNNQNNRPPLPEMPPRGMPQPGFQSRTFPEAGNGPEHFEMPIPQQNGFGFQRFQQPQGQGQNFVGAPQPQLQMRQAMPSHDMTHFGKIIPEHLHDLHLRDVTEQMKKHKMYFIGDGIKLPLHMHRHEDGTFHLSVDLQKLCSKCNSTDCKPGNKSLKPLEQDFISTNLLGSTQDKTNKKQNINEEDHSMNIEDIPLMMKTPNFEEEEERKKYYKKQRLNKRSPRFNYIDVNANTDSDIDSSTKSEKTEEKFDYLHPISQAIKDDVEHKINTFNKDIKEYYKNEAEIKKQKWIMAVFKVSLKNALVC
ncbi:LOW QUALITY PROTEIN: uncharacterized protein [Atheta coriaria]|uniref:LOW QUALITY PROTEIN: uncharacterized protein n=1 Tax=Dalotia coriaria TaxID=877792 RepID=UPI0031F35F11